MDNVNLLYNSEYYAVVEYGARGEDGYEVSDKLMFRGVFFNKAAGSAFYEMFKEAVKTDSTAEAVDDWLSHFTPIMQISTWYPQ